MSNIKLEFVLLIDIYLDAYYYYFNMSFDNKYFSHLEVVISIVLINIYKNKFSEFTFTKKFSN